MPYYTWIHIQCNIYCWNSSNNFVFGSSVCRMVRGKDYGPRIDVEQSSSSPRLNHVVTFTPRITFTSRIACIHPALHAVLNGASITSWYRRQKSQQVGHWHNPDPWTGLRQVQHFSIFVFDLHISLVHTNQFTSYQRNTCQKRLVFIGMYCNIYQYMVCIVVCIESIFAHTKL